MEITVLLTGSCGCCGLTYERQAILDSIYEKQAGQLFRNFSSSLDPCTACQDDLHQRQPNITMMRKLHQVVVVEEEALVETNMSPSSV